RRRGGRGCQRCASCPGYLLSEALLSEALLSGALSASGTFWSAAPASLGASLAASLGASFAVSLAVSGAGVPALSFGAGAAPGWAASLPSAGGTAGFASPLGA